MGLDLALGGLVLVSAFRGWLKGFLVQTIRLGGLVSAAYLAGPVRDQARPYVIDYLPSVRPELVDRLMWWGSAAASYFVIVGAASLLVAVSRRKTFGLDEANRGDQFAGFGLGVAKGLVAAAFIVASVQKYGQTQMARLPWVEDQTRESFAWDWNDRYHPAAQIWNAPPVKRFVGHVQKMGLLNPQSPEATAEAAGDPLRTASRTPSLSLPSEIITEGLDHELTRTVKEIEAQLKGLDPDPLTGSPKRR